MRQQMDEEINLKFSILLFVIYRPSSDIRIYQREERAGLCHVLKRKVVLSFLSFNNGLG
jgi:hypothetical protein